MLTAGEIPVTTRRPARGCLTPSILRACFPFMMMLISSRLKFSPLVFASVCQHLFKVLMQVSLLFLRHAKNVLFHCQNLTLFRRESLMFESWNQNLSKIEPKMCLRKGRSNGSSVRPVSCVFQAEAAASKQVFICSSRSSCSPSEQHTAPFSCWHW